MNIVHNNVLNLLDNLKYKLLDDLKYYTEATNDIEHIIPDYYLKFLFSGKGKKYHGKTFKFMADNKKEESDIGAFFVFFGNDDINIQYIFSIVKDRIPDNMLPIANDSFGNLILLHFKNDRIYFWDHETEKIYFVSSDFTKFLDSLSD